MLPVVVAEDLKELGRIVQDILVTAPVAATIWLSLTIVIDYRLNPVY
jgi:hypothetical protein